MALDSEMKAQKIMMLGLLHQMDDKQQAKVKELRIKVGELLAQYDEVTTNTALPLASLDFYENQN